MLPVLGAADLANAEVVPLPSEQRTPPISSDLVPPALTRFVPAAYPEAALARRLQGKVLLELDIDRAGRVVRARIVQGAGRGFDEAARAAALRFEFEPARRDGEPVSVTLRYLYEFRMPVETQGAAVEPAAAELPAPASQPPPEALASPPQGGQRPALGSEELVFEAEATVEAPPREVTRHSVGAQQLTRVAGTRGDAMRALEILPGVARPPTGESAPILRGSSPWESTALLDGTPIPLLYHFSSMVSTFNSRLLERVDLYPGNFSVRYGRVTGGIVEARARDPKTDRFHGMLELSMWDSSLLLETPVGSTSAVAAAARRSNLDIYFDAIAPEGAYQVVAAPVYWDYQAIAVGELTPKHRWRMMGYGSRDSVELFFEDPIESDPFLRGELRGALEFHQVQARLESELGGGVEQDLAVALGRTLLEQVIGPEVDAKLVTYGIDSRGEWRVPVGEALTVAAGFDTQVIHFEGHYRGEQAPQIEGNPDLEQPYSTEEQVDISPPSFTTLKPALYTELSIRPRPDVVVLPGVRADYFGQLREWSLEPRLSVRYRVLPQTTLKAGVGLFSQEPVYYESMDEIGNPDIELARALHASVGAEHEMGDTIEIGAEAFYKRLVHRVVGTEVGAPPRFINDGSGRVYGLELSSVVRPAPGTFGYLAYTLSRSERRDRADPWRLFDHDQTHNLTVAATHELGRGWEVGARFRLVSGNPNSPIVGSVYDARTAVYQPVFGKVNSDRLPVYHQLDLLGQKTWSFSDWSLAAYLDLQNAYNASVREGTEYSYDYSQSRPTSGMPIFPNLGVRGEL